MINNYEVQKLKVMCGNRRSDQIAHVSDGLLDNEPVRVPLVF